MTKQVAVWIDHKEAHLFALSPEHADESSVAAPLHNVHSKHPRGSEGGKEHPEDAKHFFQEVERGLEGADEILLVGPGVAKLDFMRHVHKHDHALEPRIVGIETVDHPTDRQLVAYARAYFDKRDRTSSR